MGTQKNRLNEAVLLSMQNIYAKNYAYNFYAEKIVYLNLSSCDKTKYMHAPCLLSSRNYLLITTCRTDFLNPDH